MKISKVNHTKFGVAEQPVNAAGMLYTYQTKEEGKKEIYSHVENRVSEARALYKIFIIGKGIKCKKEASLALAYFENECFSGLKKNKDSRSIYNFMLGAFGYTIRSGKGIQFRVGDDWNSKESPESIAKNIVSNTLRQSLRRVYKNRKSQHDIYIPDVITKVVVALFSGADYKLLLEKSQSDILVLIDALREDYIKEKKSKQIADSIEKQCVPVQIAEDGKHLILSLANNAKKKYIFDFMKEYAGADSEKQKELWIHMRYLVLLYVYGEDIARDSLDSGSIKHNSFGMNLIEQDGSFSEELESLISEKMNRAQNDLYSRKVSEVIVSHYQKALSAEDLSDNDKSWIRYISDYVTKLITVKHKEGFRLKKSYLCKNVWEEWLSFISLKYIELGKGAYYFAMPDTVNASKGQPSSFGSVDNRYLAGISSFDYERIKAEDSLKRSLSSYVSFALNNFSTSVINIRDLGEKQEDVLSLNFRKEDDCKLVRSDSKKQVARYFGGISSFDSSPFEGLSDVEFVDNLRKYFVVTRNSSFHFYTGAFKDMDTSVLNVLFNKELHDVSKIYRKRYYSNNVHLFYDVSDINVLMDSLYSFEGEKVALYAQVPSFNKVLSRAKVNDFLSQYMEDYSWVEKLGSKNADIFRSSLYFVMKEIYYNAFLKEKDLKERFINALEIIGDAKNQKAHAEFRARFDELVSNKLSFDEICQEIMTEYNQQNNQMKIKPAFVKVINKDSSTEYKESDDSNHKYQHYRMILYVGIAEAFRNYLNGCDIFRFLRKPSDRTNTINRITEEEFIKAWDTNAFASLKESLESRKLVSAWYITAHFLDAKNINHLIGEFKNYIQFTRDIEKRAEVTNNTRRSNHLEKIEDYERVIDILEFVKLFSGQTSNNIVDYFDSEDDYAQYLANFVDYGGNDKNELWNFCRDNEYVNYYDERNPIVNKNVVLATMFGNKDIISSAFVKINSKEFKSFKKDAEKLEKVFTSGVCTAENEQTKLKRYQNIKNRIELVDVLSMTELLNDLYGQLINYSFLRERDLMFMQLGFYYTKLFYTDSLSENDILRRIEGEACNISDGAILYQIAAMYSYDLPVFDREGKLANSGHGIKDFYVKYASADVYNDGLCFFEDIDKHDPIVNKRNYIDHFKYFAQIEGESILDLYSYVYNNFFTYNLKLKKSVSFILPNILLRYFVIAKLEFTHHTEGNVSSAEIALTDTLESDRFKYKLSDADGTQVKASARNREYLDGVKNLLLYPHMEK